jgi:uncharacterized protein (TIGR00369 family)
LGSKVDIDVVLQQLCHTFNSSPFFSHNGMTMRVVDQQIEGYIEMQPYMIGNVAFQILHGGVAATILDSVGGIVAMGELYKRTEPEQLPDTIKKVTRLATVDMRVDYLAPGRGKFFVARAETLRLGRKGCTMRMTLVNDEDKAIATAIASYAF